MGLNYTDVFAHLAKLNVEILQQRHFAINKYCFSRGYFADVHQGKLLEIDRDVVIKCQKKHLRDIVKEVEILMLLRKPEPNPNIGTCDGYSFGIKEIFIDSVSAS